MDGHPPTWAIYATCSALQIWLCTMDQGDQNMSHWKIKHKKWSVKQLRLVKLGDLHHFTKVIFTQQFFLLATGSPVRVPRLNDLQDHIQISLQPARFCTWPNHCDKDWLRDVPSNNMLCILLYQPEKELHLTNVIWGRFPCYWWPRTW